MRLSPGTSTNVPSSEPGTTRGQQSAAIMGTRTMGTRTRTSVAGPSSKIFLKALGNIRWKLVKAPGLLSVLHRQQGFAIDNREARHLVTHRMWTPCPQGHRHEARVFVPQSSWEQILHCMMPEQEMDTHKTNFVIEPT